MANVCCIINFAVTHTYLLFSQEIESVKLKEKLKEEENLRHELSDKQNRVTQMEAELTFLGNVLKKKMQESERKTEDLSLLQSQVSLILYLKIMSHWIAGL